MSNHYNGLFQIIEMSEGVPPLGHLVSRSFSWISFFEGIKDKTQLIYQDINVNVFFNRDVVAIGITNDILQRTWSVMEPARYILRY